MAERFFTKVANDVLAASEQLSNRLEDGIAAILTGDLALKQKEGDAGAGSSSGSGAGSVPPQYEHEFDDQFEIPEEELRHNPLQGIAESVVGDIMGGQVRYSMSFSSWRRLGMPTLESSYFGTISLHFLSLYPMTFTVRTSNASRTLGRLSTSHYMVGTLYFGAGSVSTRHVSPLSVGITSKRGTHASHCTHGDDCGSSQIGRIFESNSGRALGEFCDAKLF
jgi:hypothetical protein